MRFFLFIIPAFFSVYGQVPYTTVFHCDYRRLPIQTRVAHSGIYGIDAFTVNSDGVTLLESGTGARCFFPRGGGNSARMTNAKKPTAGLSYEQMRSHPLLAPKAFDASGAGAWRQIGDGEYQLNAMRILLRRESSSMLMLAIDSAGGNITLRFPFDATLGSAEFIGTDRKGNVFILYEEYPSHISAGVIRTVLGISRNDGTVKSFRVPLRKYITTIKEFETDEAGNVYQFLSDERGITIIQWQAGRMKSGKYATLPAEWDAPLHYNFFTPSNDPKTEISANLELAVIERAAVLKTAETYVQYRYTLNSGNLSPAVVFTPDGDSLQTPPRLSTGMNAEVAYKWGGFNSLSGFASGIASGKYAGDIHCDSETNYAVGVDCSGFLSRCWGLSSHVTTANLPSITTLLPSWDSLKPADAILRTGHVRMFIERTSTGSFRVVESSGRDWGVSYWTYSLSDLSAYAPRAYAQMSAKSFDRIPVLKRVLAASDNTVRLSWACDTSSVAGYRLYKSTNGSAWSLLLNETTLKSQSADIPLTDSAAYYRVACVKNDAPNYSEGFWSNVLFYTKYYSPKKYLLVHGFTRTGGNWRSTSDEFAIRYGKAFESIRKKCESVKNSELLTGIDLRNYDAVFWMLGDESTANATFSDSEQPLVKQYLEAGGSLFVSGSEIGYDLFGQGSASDKSFFNNYLKAAYIADDAASETVSGNTGKALQNCSFTFGQTYAVTYPDEINPNGGSELCAQYGNGKGAGVQFTGTFGASALKGRLIYLAFPLETTAEDTAMNRVVRQAAAYLHNGGNLNVKLIPQGFLDTLSNLLAARDTLRLYLAQVTFPYALVDSAVVLLDSAAFTGTGLFRNAPSGSYYIVARHRNSVETWSRTGGESFSSEGVLSYNFTASAAMAFGSNMIKRGAYYCLYGGDVNQDGIVDFSDLSAVDNASNAFTAGYVPEDITGDLFVDFSDVSITDNNSYNFIGASKPESARKKSAEGLIR